jgi:hypothetical protein
MGSKKKLVLDINATVKVTEANKKQVENKKNLWQSHFSFTNS